MLRAELSRRWSTSNSFPFSRSRNRFNSARSPITIETVTGPDHSHRHTRPTDVIGRLMMDYSSWVSLRHPPQETGLLPSASDPHLVSTTDRVLLSEFVPRLTICA